MKPDFCNSAETFKTWQADKASKGFSENAKYPKKEVKHLNGNTEVNCEQHQFVKKHGFFRRLAALLLTIFSVGIACASKTMRDWIVGRTVVYVDVAQASPTTKKADTVAQKKNVVPERPKAKSAPAPKAKKEEPAPIPKAQPPEASPKKEEDAQEQPAPAQPQEQSDEIKQSTEEKKSQDLEENLQEQDNNDTDDEQPSTGTPQYLLETVPGVTPPQFDGNNQDEALLASELSTVNQTIANGMDPYSPPPKIERVVSENLVPDEEEGIPDRVDVVNKPDARFSGLTPLEQTKFVQPLKFDSDTFTSEVDAQPKKKGSSYFDLLNMGSPNVDDPDSALDEITKSPTPIRKAMSTDLDDLLAQLGNEKKDENSVNETTTDKTKIPPERFIKAFIRILGKVSDDIQMHFWLFLMRFAGKESKVTGFKYFHTKGEFTLTVNQPMKLWVPPYSDEDPVGGVVVILGMDDQGKPIPFKGKMEEGKLTFIQGFSTYACSLERTKVGFEKPTYRLINMIGLNAGLGKMTDICAEGTVVDDHKKFLENKLQQSALLNILGAKVSTEIENLFATLLGKFAEKDATVTKFEFNKDDHSFELNLSKPMKLKVGNSTFHFEQNIKGTMAKNKISFTKGLALDPTKKNKPIKSLREKSGKFILRTKGNAQMSTTKEQWDNSSVIV